MNRKLRSKLSPCSVLLGCCLLMSLNGCVYRQLLIDTPLEQRGAVVKVNGKTVGAAPVVVPFTYYGDYEITIDRDGYERLTVKEPIPAPFYEYFPLDFVSEHLIPFPIRDFRRRTYTLTPLREISPEYLNSQALQFRTRGQILGNHAHPGTPSFSPQPSSTPIPDGPEPLPVPRPTNTNPSTSEPPPVELGIPTPK